MLKKLLLLSIVSVSIATVAADAPFYKRCVTTAKEFFVAAPVQVAPVVIQIAPVVTPTRLQTTKNAISTFAANSKTKVAALVTSVRATKLQDIKNAVISKRGAAVSAAVVVVGAAYWFRNEIKGFFGLNAKSDAKN